MLFNDKIQGPPRWISMDGSDKREADVSWEIHRFTHVLIKIYQEKC